MTTARNRLYVLLGISMLIASFQVGATVVRVDGLQSTAQIRPTRFSVHGPFDYAIDLVLSGDFEVMVKPGVYNWAGSVSPNRIQFTNIDVPVDAAGSSWEFPSFEGFFQHTSSTSFTGSEDWCYSFHWHSVGTCWSVGYFGSFSGQWDGATLRLTGSKATPDNVFSYTIVANAVAVAEPATVLLSVFGFLAIGAQRSISRRSLKKARVDSLR